MRRTTQQELSLLRSTAHALRAASEGVVVPPMRIFYLKEAARLDRVAFRLELLGPEAMFARKGKRA